MITLTDLEQQIKNGGMTRSELIELINTGSNLPEPARIFASYMILNMSDPDFDRISILAVKVFDDLKNKNFDSLSNLLKECGIPPALSSMIVTYAKNIH